MGHSSGSQIAYCSILKGTMNSEKIVGLILLSPVDDLYIIKNDFDNKVNNKTS